MRQFIVCGTPVTAPKVAAGPSEPEKYAAGELVKYLRLAGIDAEEISGEVSAENGADVIISVDPSLPDDGFSVSPSEGGKLRIAGGNGRGAIYAVYRLLERFAGMRFFMPGLERYGEGDIVIAEELNFAPVFETRQSDWPCGNGDVDWCLKNMINVRPIPDSQGGHVRYGGFVHTMRNLNGTPWNEQPCLTDPEVLKKTIASVREILKKDPGIKIVSVSQNDNKNYCKCPRCAAVDEEEGSQAGTLLRFVNAVASDIAADYPDVVIDTLAYQYTRRAPKITRPLPNVCIRLCSIECCFSHPLNDPTCGVNAAFVRDIIEWNRICDRIYIWDYVTNFHYYVPTFPNFGVIRENMRFFAEHGVRGMYPEGNYHSLRSGEFGELRCYLLAKLMGDPFMSATEYRRHTDEFLEAYYGAGWRFVKAYLDLIVEEAKGRHMSIWAPPFKIVDRDYYAEMEDTFDRLWDEAERLAGDRIDEVRRSRLQWRTIKLMLHPDAEKAGELLDELSRRKIRWTEANELPVEPDLSASPETWRRR